MRIFKAAVVAAVAIAAVGLAAFQAAPPVSLPLSVLDMSPARTGEGYAKTFPLVLRKTERPGAALIECRVSEAFKLEHCLVLGETPKGGDVGTGAIKFMNYGALAHETEDGRTTAGGYITRLVQYRMPRKPAAEVPFILGEPAYIITRTAIGDPTGSIACATGDTPGRCFLHPLPWSSGLQGMPETVRKIGKTSGKSAINCAFDAERHLNDCVTSDDLTAEQTKTLIDRLSTYNVRPATLDGVVVANTRMIVFLDWAALNEAIDKSVLMAAR